MVVIWTLRLLEAFRAHRWSLYFIFRHRHIQLHTRPFCLQPLRCHWSTSYLSFFLPRFMFSVCLWWCEISWTNKLWLNLCIMFNHVCEMFEGMMRVALAFWKKFVSLLYDFGRPEIVVKTKAKVNDIVSPQRPSLDSVLHVCRPGHPQSNTKQRLFKEVVRFTLHV